VKSDATVKICLNTALRDQLTAINQFFLHARMLGNWGLEGLEKREYSHSIRAMKQADKLMQRVLFLEGLPNPQMLGKLLVGEHVPEILQNDLQLQTGTRSGLQAGIVECEQAEDYVSRNLLEKLLEESEEHIDWLETQLWLIEKTGAENYLQSQI